MYCCVCLACGRNGGQLGAVLALHSACDALLLKCARGVFCSLQTCPVPYSTRSNHICSSAAGMPLATEQAEAANSWFCRVVVVVCVACVPLRTDIASSNGSSRIAHGSYWQGMQRTDWCSAASTFGVVCAYYACHFVAVVCYNSVITVTYPEPCAFPL